MALVLSAEGSFEVGATDDSSNLASTSSTRPPPSPTRPACTPTLPKRDVVHVAVDEEPVPAPVEPARF
ncbi:hypothetical protein G7Z17_g9952 [Cylindrodendrum hubeiense]|uniref:Uncharacterized protein n=1 Tax=Cylindrodendrum hubeiense TaxID=595255 RepID=A0A9P5H2C6_9HYPO|nr:hypothetical protein G7Z17_g9952 [Cylindrodendrum hubeiense]